TVKGDVHDIGKNIVGVVLGCNGYDVVDLGVMVPADKILAAAREQRADVIGLSGLITPSLDEMVHVAREMERTGMTTPLLIGGATTSKIHTAVKVAPQYGGAPVVHVLDASKSVPTVAALLSDEQRPAFAAGILAEYAEVRERYLSRNRQQKLLSIGKARDNALAFDWAEVPVVQPERPGVTAFDAVTVGDLRPLIDWSPFFIAWEMKGSYPALLSDPHAGETATRLYEDAQEMLDEIEAGGLLHPRGVAGLWPANAVGDDVELYTDASRTETLAVMHTLRQQTEKTPGKPNRALADFVAPRDTDIADWVGAFIVSIHGAEELAARYREGLDDYRAILAQSLADRLAEAFAEWLHRHVRTDLWGYEAEESLSNDDLIRERYRGIRPAPGYPAQPDHTEKTTLFRLLDAEAHTGTGLTEHLAMTPPASVCGVYLAHPDADYFNLGLVNRDQVEDYAARKGMPLHEVERWLAPALAYEPEAPTPSGDGVAADVQAPVQ
ncbi:MAG TPA: vitamin B12 dependent-methionine synthase activation domain-containing protein, partial [Rhodothermales bacterium]|nr:vitamin B12 dependent-methionine synthase activation domain-containing protein [Rhodothermales bacterium]